MSKNKILLLVIIALAFSLRFFQLGTNPPSLTWDEVAWGYNAYSLGIDGKDEFGRFLPHDYLESFGDFKPPMYAYLTVLPVLLWGLTEFAVRFPSAFFGSLSVIFTYFLVKQLFKDSKNKESYALLSAFLLAISPWHIMLSRAAFEANVASFFIIAGGFFFLKGVQERMLWILVAAIFFVASLYTFNSARIAAPLIALLLGVSSYKIFLKKKKMTLLALFVGFFLTLPILGFLLSPQASLRFKEVNIFTDSKVVEMANQQIANNDNALWSKVVHNRRVGYARSYIKHYFDHFNFDFLFIKGDGNVKFSTQDVGSMYLWELPFLIAGLLYLVRKKEGKWWIVPLWILVAIIPAGTARETPHALRIENALPMFQILTAYGIVSLYVLGKSLLKNHSKLFMLFPTLTSILCIFFLTYFLHGYYFHYPREFSGEWQYGYKEALAYINAEKNNYDEVRMTTELGRPHEYYLFYSKTDPEVFRSNSSVERDPFGFVNVDRVENVIFGSDEINKKSDTKKILVVEIPRKIPDQHIKLREFYLKNGEVALVAYTFEE